MANANKKNIKRFIENISEEVATDAYNGGGSGNTVSRTFKVSLDVQCYWRELTFIYDSNDTTPNYTPQYQEESDTWTGLEELVAHFKEVLTNGKVIYGYGYGQSPSTNLNETYPFAMKWDVFEESEGCIGIYEIIDNGELQFGTWIQSDGSGLDSNSTITDYINE